MELLTDVVPPGVINVVTGYGGEAGAALATSSGIAKLGFTGSTGTGMLAICLANLPGQSTLPIFLANTPIAMNLTISRVHAGTAILKAAADSLIPTTLELGGKPPRIDH